MPYSASAISDQGHILPASLSSEDGYLVASSSSTSSQSKMNKCLFCKLFIIAIGMPSTYQTPGHRSMSLGRENKPK